MIKRIKNFKIGNHQKIYQPNNIGKCRFSKYDNGKFAINGAIPSSFIYL